ncbi:MAG TPA: enoyl-CoA hydratase/isomerase family protein [Acidobacteriaceae bacterium]|jgi:enoyl-CoA hydratase/carnithine racemase
MENTSLILTRSIDTGSGVVFEITLNRPEKGNALTSAMLAELRDIIRAVYSDRAIRVVVLRGAGKFFCTGGDINDWGAMAPHQMAADWILPGIEVFAALSALPQPVIAVMQGHTFGGGLELAMACDLRVAAPGIKIGMPEVRLGMVAGWGGVRRLAEMIGVSLATSMTLTGEAIDSETAHHWGLLHSVSASVEGLEEEVQRLVNVMLKNGPIAMRVTKGLLATMHQDFRFAHASAVAQVSSTEDCREGTAAFREKRPATFKNS